MFSRISLRGKVVRQMHDAARITHVGAPGPEPCHHCITQGEEEEKEEGRVGVRLTRLEATLESHQRRTLENRLIEK